MPVCSWSLLVRMTLRVARWLLVALQRSLRLVVIYLCVCPRSLYTNILVDFQVLGFKSIFLVMVYIREVQFAGITYNDEDLSCTARSLSGNKMSAETSIRLRKTVMAPSSQPLSTLFSSNLHYKWQQINRCLRKIGHGSCQRKQREGRG